MTYAEKLTDPRWQKKRLQILNRDDFTCKLCGDKDTTLHVHHKSYGINPWDTNNKDLITYCAHCHSIVEFYKTEKLTSIPVKVFKVTTENFHMLYCLAKNARNAFAILSFEYSKETGELDFRSMILPDLLEIINKELTVQRKR